MACVTCDMHLDGLCHCFNISTTTNLYSSQTWSLSLTWKRFRALTAALSSLMYWPRSREVRLKELKLDSSESSSRKRTTAAKHDIATCERHHTHTHTHSGHCCAILDGDMSQEAPSLLHLFVQLWQRVAGHSLSSLGSQEPVQILDHVLAIELCSLPVRDQHAAALHHL